MAVYTATKQFTANRTGGEKSILIVKASGGSVALAYKFGEEYITAEVFTVDTVKVFNTDADFQVSVTGSATYAIE
jgi:hypothetical protein